jgi:hypothetical protein
VPSEKKDDTTNVTNKKEKESDSELLHNPTRVVKAQVCRIDFEVMMMTSSSLFSIVVPCIHCGLS